MSPAVPAGILLGLACVEPGISAPSPPHPPAPEIEMSTADASPLQRYQAHIAARGGDPSGVIARPAQDAGEFAAFQDATGQWGFADGQGVLETSGAGNWNAFLQAGSPDEVAERVVMMLSDSQARALRGPAPPGIPAADWPAVVEVRPDGAAELRAWIGYPPGFAPTRLIITAPPAGPATFRREAPAAAPAAAPPLDTLVESLRSGSSQAQKAAAVALGERGDPGAVPALGEALSHRWVDVRKAAAASLGRIGSEAGLAPLEGAVMAEADPYAIVAMLDAVVAIGGAEGRAVLGRVAEAHPVALGRDRAAAELAR